MFHRVEHRIAHFGLYCCVLAAGCGGDVLTEEVSTAASSEAMRQSFDVVVVGAGSGGIAAAIQASRMGASVALVEETDWIGGQMTAGAVPNMDGALLGWTSSGLYAEFEQRVRAHYGKLGKSVGTCYFNREKTCFEVSVGRQILHAMLAEIDVELFLRSRVLSVAMEGKTVVGVALDGQRFLDSHVLVDATEYGDVIPLTGARYRVGNSLSDDIDPSACVQAPTYVGVIKKYAQGVPAPLQMGGPPPGYDDTVRARFATYVAKNGAAFEGWAGPRPWSWATHNGYRGMPDSSRPGSYTAAEPSQITRTGINLANDYPGTVWANRQKVAGPRVDYIEDRVRRHQINCQAKLLTLQFLYYAQTELGESSWSLADDEGYDTAYNREENDCDAIPAHLEPLERSLPVMPYVRESRRIVAVDTLTAAEIKRNSSTQLGATPFSSSIAVGDYGTDLHACRRDGDFERDLNETAADASGRGAFQVPLETLIPETVDGFLAAEKNIGASRLAAGAIRLQPITMLTGQAVGVTAALAVEANLQPRDVRPIDVQRVLVKAGSALAMRNFQDVPRSHRFWWAVQLANVYGIFNGYDATHFGVGDPLTRGQAAIVLTRLFELDTSNPPASPSFTDVSVGDSAYAPIEAIYDAGITNGCGGSSFCPDQPLKRAHLAAFVARALELPVSVGPTFDDVDAQSAFYDAITAVAAAGIMIGCDPSKGRFCPDEVATRGQAAVVAARVLARQR